MSTRPNISHKLFHAQLVRPNPSEKSAYDATTCNVKMVRFKQIHTILNHFKGLVAGKKNNKQNKTLTDKPDKKHEFIV